MAGSVSSWIARSSLKDFPQFRYSSAAQLIGHCEIHHTERLSLESPADIAEAFNACFSTLANDKLLHSEIHADFGWVVLHFIQRSCPHGSDGFPPVDAHNNFRHVGSVWPCFPMQTSGQIKKYGIRDPPFPRFSSYLSDHFQTVKIRRCFTALCCYHWGHSDWRPCSSIRAIW